MKYTLSKYTKVIELDETEEMIVYNTVTGKQSVIFDESLIQQIRSLVDRPISSEQLDKRIVENYCVAVNDDEDLRVYHQIRKIIGDENSLSLIIFPTLECNFKCKYCYENKEAGFMSQATIENIYSSIVAHYETVGFGFLKIEWFGGEPLLFYDQILDLTTRINNFCQSKNIVFQHSMTTNGSLLKKKLAEELIDASVNIFQITVDGMAETHDKYRYDKFGNPTWERITNNLLQMKTIEKQFKVLIRVNYNFEILNSIERFLEYFSFNFKDDARFEIAFKAIGHWGGENDDQYSAISSEYHPYIMEQLLKKCGEMDIYPAKHYNFACGSELCYANKKHTYVIYKNGCIGKCTLEESPDCESPFVIGDINEGYFNINAEKEKLWILDDKFYIEYLRKNKCFGCIAYPFCCGSSCPAYRVKNGFEVSPKCSPTKDNLDQIVYLNYEKSKTRLF